MSDTPRSEKSETRFSTPVSDLDDHRRQPQSMPRADASPVRSRRPTFASVNGQVDRPNLLIQVNEALEAGGITARDFEENAIIDDDALSPEGHGRRGSVQAHSPSARRNTFRRPRDPAIERLVRSRASSTTSRSTSPPNSVDAFAGPRRRDRANTLESRPASFVELNLQRTVSRGTARRPTISDERPDDVKSVKSVSAASSAEEDVCFPVEEDFGKTTRFDYEELEEFVAECQERTPIGQSLRHKPSVTSQLSKKIFSDLRPKSNLSNRKDDIETTTLKDVDPAVQEKLAEEA